MIAPLPDELTVISPQATAASVARDVWQRRGLVAHLAMRDVRVRYRQTLVGAAWAVLQPIGMAAVFSVFLGYLARIPSEGVPYPLFVLSGITIWTFFTQSLMSAANSVVSNPSLVTKVYIPRIIIPVAAATPHLLDIAASSVVLAGFVLILGDGVTWNLLAAPLVIAATWVFATCLGCAVAAVNVRYRDVKYTLPFVVQVWLFSTPVVYSAELVPDTWSWAYYLNPMAGLVEAFRWSFLGVGHAPLWGVVPAVALVAGSLVYFVRVESSFADAI